MTIKQQGGIFGRNPSFNDLEAEQVTVNGRVNIQSNRPQIFLYEQDRTDNNARIECSFDSLNISQVDDSNGSPVARLTVEMDTGDVYVNDGNLVIGTSGKGIDFSATSGTGTSELFDDYEEGTFTPVVADAASGGNVATASSAYGYYTKVGRVVTVTIDLQNINTSGLTSGNNIFITGLPFSAGSLTGNINYTGLVNGGGTLSSAKSVIAVVYDNVSYIRLVEATSTSVTGWLDVSEINSGATDFRFSVTYFA